VEGAGKLPELVVGAYSHSLAQVPMGKPTHALRDLFQRAQRSVNRQPDDTDSDDEHEYGDRPDLHDDLTGPRRG
jgi:hypothetical protein